VPAGGKSKLNSTHFLITGVRRTGSNLLAGMLDSHPEITCHHELFHPMGIYYSLSYRDEMTGCRTIKQRDKAPGQFLDFVWNYDYRKDNKAIGFKLFPGQNKKMLERLLRDSSVTKIILKRSNLLHLYTSFLISKKTGVYSLLVNGDRKQGEPLKIVLKVKKFFKYVKEIQRYYQHVETVLRQTGQVFKTLEYETMLTGDEQTALLEFLGVDSRPGLLEVKHKKQNPNHLKDRVSNYEELARQLKGTPYEIFLDQ
jgi:LPS sulfotransferase NodH